MGFGEDPRLSPMGVLEGIDFPAWRDTLIGVAEDAEACADVINLFKSLPRGKYESREELMRDFAEAARRFGTGSDGRDDDGAVRDRRNLGRDAVEGATNGRTRHP